MRRAIVILAAVLALSADALFSSPAAEAQGGVEELGRRVERLGQQVHALKLRVRRLRTALRESRSRIARLEDQVSGQSAGRLRSADGRFVLDISNEGIRLRGPGALLALAANSLTLSAGPATALELAPGNATLQSPSGLFGFSAGAALTAPLVSLGAASGCPPVARRNDAVRVPLAGEILQGTITGGSTNVVAC